MLSVLLTFTREPAKTFQSQLCLSNVQNPPRDFSWILSLTAREFQENGWSNWYFSFGIVSNFHTVCSWWGSENKFPFCWRPPQGLQLCWCKHYLYRVKNMWKSYIWTADKDMNESDPRSNVHYLGSSENKAWSWVQIPYRPEFFSGPIFTTA